MDFKTFLYALALGHAMATSEPHFLSVPALERFPDGAFEWKGLFSCEGASDWLATVLEFSLDYDLDGKADESESFSPSSVSCSDGQLEISRTLFPAKPGILTVFLKSGAAVESESSVLGQAGNILSIRSFCARPISGEPEWIEIRNASSLSIPLANIRLEGKILTGILESGKSIFVAGDSTAFRIWRPEATVLETGSWSYLRNTGDTLRLSFQNLETNLVLDSVLYGAAMGYSLESCASLAGGEAGEVTATGYGFTVEATPKKWNPAGCPLTVVVNGPTGSPFVLRLYDMDGHPQCAPRTGITPTTISLFGWECANYSGAGTAILHVTSGKARVREAIQIGDP